jgi:hypothetical protein
LFFHCSSDCSISIEQSISRLIASSCTFEPIQEILIADVVLFSFFYSFVSICFKNSHLFLMEYSYDRCCTALSNNFNIWIISGL